MTALDLFATTGAFAAPRRVRHRRWSWLAIADFVLTGIGVTTAGGVIGFGLAF